MRQKSFKGSRINSDMQRVISHVIGYEIKDPRVSGQFISVVKTEVTKDLKECKCYVSILGQGAAQNDSMKEAMKGLQRAEGFIRSRLAEALNLRNTPQITFVLDHSIEYGVEMSKKIDEVLRQDHEKNGSEGKDMGE